MENRVVRAILRCLLATELLLGTLLPSFAQSPQVRADRVGHAIDLLGSIRSTVAQGYSGQEVKVYKLVSVRLLMCAGLYVILAKKTPASDDDAARVAAFAEGSAVYALASSWLYAGPPDQYQQDVSKVQADVLKITAENDQTNLLHLLRNCADLSSSSTVTNAVADLLEDNEPDYIKPLGRVSPHVK
jgi:hypothetical protein